MLAGLVLSAGIAFATPQPGEVATQLVREACVGTGMQKDAFERLGPARDAFGRAGSLVCWL